jgi:biopolymer transport protein ExbD
MAISSRKKLELGMKNRWHSSADKLQKANLNSEINVTPLVDVCLVLLIIFMVVTPMLQKGVPVNIPVTEEPEKTPDTEKQLQISVKSDGTVYLGSTVVRKEQVQSELETIHQRTPDREIAVKGDKLVKYGAVLDVLKACREVGFNNVGLIAQPKKGPGQT